MCGQTVRGHVNRYLNGLAHTGAMHLWHIGVAGFVGILCVGPLASGRMLLLLLLLLMMLLLLLVLLLLLICKLIMHVSVRTTIDGTGMRDSS